MFLESDHQPCLSYQVSAGDIPLSLRKHPQAYSGLSHSWKGELRSCWKKHHVSMYGKPESLGPGQKRHDERRQPKCTSRRQRHARRSLNRSASEWNRPIPPGDGGRVARSTKIQARRITYSYSCSGRCSVAAMGAPLAQGAAGAIREKMDRKVGVTVMLWCRDRGAQDGRLMSAEVNGGRGANSQTGTNTPGWNRERSCCCSRLGFPKLTNGLELKGYFVKFFFRTPGEGEDGEWNSDH